MWVVGGTRTTGGDGNGFYQIEVNEIRRVGRVDQGLQTKNDAVHVVCLCQ